MKNADPDFAIEFIAQLLFSCIFLILTAMTSITPLPKIALLILIHMSEENQRRIAAMFDFVYAPDPASRAAMIAAAADPAHAVHATQAVLTNGTAGLSAVEMRALPNLTLVCAQGAGVENIDAVHAAAHGIEVANGAGTNENVVADQALALLLAVVRAIPQFDRACREGVWRDALPMRPQLSGKCLGVVGLGNIGQKIARRAAAFDMQIAYCGRSQRPDVSYPYYAHVAELAAWSDVLVLATPGGAATRHLVSSAELKALGPDGYLVNIGRGSVVDTAALAQALRNGEIAGAGLDVYESEPLPPAALLDLPNVVLSPHVAGRSPEAINASISAFMAHAARHFASRGHE